MAGDESYFPFSHNFCRVSPLKKWYGHLIIFWYSIAILLSLSSLNSGFHEGSSFVIYLSRLPVKQNFIDIDSHYNPIDSFFQKCNDRGVYIPFF